MAETTEESPPEQKHSQDLDPSIAKKFPTMSIKSITIWPPAQRTRDVVRPLHPLQALRHSLSRVTTMPPRARELSRRPSPPPRRPRPREPLELSIDDDGIEILRSTPKRSARESWRRDDQAKGLTSLAFEQTRGTLYVSSHEPDITIAQYDDDEAEKEIEVISERSEEPQKENEEDQPLVLVKPPTLPCIFVRPCKGVDVKERLRIFYTVDSFVLDDHDSTNSFVLEVPSEHPIMKEGVHDALPKYVDASFVVDISKGEGIT
ncbi:hypothetical protein Syun_014516 [Stephania yunnanensis]|uniref:Uncharacterized protein n=1 Tax=Stephania yunnanensis TaxID=152371 RepID=A0AAP0JJG8_9MAGN